MPTFHIEIHGQGEDVVLLHGAPSPPRHFGALAHALSAKHRVLVPHLPGYGNTPRSPRGWTLADLDAKLGESLRSVGCEEAHLIGYSAGVLRALSVALGGLVKARSIYSISGLSGLWSEEQADFRQFAEAVRAKMDLSAVARARFLSPPFADAHPESVAEVVSWLGEVDQVSLADELEALGVSQPDLTPRLATLHCRLTARAGELDLAVPIAHAEQMVAAASNATLQRVAGAGHALLLEDYEATLASIRASLAS